MASFCKKPWLRIPALIFIIYGQLTTATNYQDCGKLSSECVLDHQNAICYFFYDDARNDVAFRKIQVDPYDIDTVSSTIASGVNVYWNYSTILLEITKEHQKTKDIRIEFFCLPCLPHINDINVSIRSYDIRLTSSITNVGDNQQVILNCSAVGVYNTSNLIEFRFNDEKSLSCTEEKWPDESDIMPYVRARLLDDNATCQLIISNASNLYHNGDYHCRVKLKPEKHSQTCYLQSKTISLSLPNLYVSNKQNSECNNKRSNSTNQTSNSTAIIISLGVLLGIAICICIGCIILRIKHRCRGNDPDNVHQCLLDPQGQDNHYGLHQHHNPPENPWGEGNGNDDGGDPIGARNDQGDDGHVPHDDLNNRGGNNLHGGENDENDENDENEPNPNNHPNEGEDRLGGSNESRKG